VADNDLSKVIPKLLAQGLLALRQNAVMPRIVNGDYQNMAAQKGDTINVPIPSAIAVNAVAPGATPPTDTQAIAPDSVPIAMDQWMEAPFFLTDKDLMEVMNGTIPMQASEAVKALANNVDSYLLGLYTKFYGIVGTPGTTPFGSNHAEITAARVLLNKQLAPLGSRRFVFDPDCEGSALNLRAFTDASFTGDAQAINEGQIIHKFGFDWHMDQNVKTHTPGTLADGTVNGAHATTGVKTISIASTAGGTLKKGDIITLAGDTQTYAVGADVTIGATSNADVTISPGLQVALSGSEAVTVTASHVANLAFHRDAVAFANRPLADNTQGLGNLVQSAQDPKSGLVLRLEISREHKRTRYAFDILYGGNVVRPELGVRVAG